MFELGGVWRRRTYYGWRVPPRTWRITVTQPHYLARATINPYADAGRLERTVNADPEERGVSAHDLSQEA